MSSCIHAGATIYRSIYIEVLLLEAGHCVVVVSLFAAMLKC